MGNTAVQLDVLAFGAHPDDVELFCSGTLIKLRNQGHSTGVYSLTRGELGTRGSEEIRTREFDQATAVMDVSVHGMLDIPDGQVSPSWENKLRVIRVIRAHRPRLVLAPYWEDRHPDHTNASQLVKESVFLGGLVKVDTGQEPFRPCQLIYYASWSEFQPSFIVDISEIHERKMKAIAAYRSQVHQAGKTELDDGETPVSDPRFLERLITRARRYGSAIGTTYGEGFLVSEPLQLDDLVKFFEPCCADKMPRGL